MPAATQTPQCPKCSGKMILRKSSRGPFFGCAKFPQCNGTRNADGRDTSRKEDAVAYQPIPIMPGSDEQEAIWEYALEGRGHMVINSGPGCLVGDTLIDCPRDLTKYPAGIPIRNLVGMAPYVYGYSEKLRQIVLRKATRVWKTGEKIPVYKVTFRNAFSPKKRPNAAPPYYVIGTADHPFLLRIPPADRAPGWNMKPPVPGGWKELTQLKPGDRVIAFLRQSWSDESMINLNNGETVIESRFILSELTKTDKNDLRFHAHHKNERHLDHTPSNLEWKSATEHASHHLTKRNLEGTTGWQKTGIHPRGMLGKHQTEKQAIACRLTAEKRRNDKVKKGDLVRLYVRERRSVSETARILGVGPRSIEVQLQKHGIAQRDISSQKRYKNEPYWKAKGLDPKTLRKEYEGEGITPREIAIRHGVFTSAVYQRLRQYGIALSANHIVEKVEFYGYEDVYNMTVEGCHNFVANGVITHNTGKTHTAVQYCLRAPKDLDILIIAYNRHIALEANGKLRASKCWNTKASTQHSLGRRILMEHFKSLSDKPNEGKMTEILESLVPAPLYGKGEWRKLLNLTEKLASYVKNYLVDYTASNFQEELERIADHHGLDLNGSFVKAINLIPPALEECKKRAPLSIDYDDMIWLPVVLDLPMLKPPNRLIVDEAQDLNVVQHEMVFKACPTGRIMVIGDKRQSIYSFRGASTASIEILTKRLSETKRGVKEFPLTITRRCPKLHVKLAQALFPEIRALDDAPEGIIEEMPYANAVREMRVGDMAICRINKELITTAYALIRRGVRPAIKGRDFGQGLLALVDTLQKLLDIVPGNTEMDKVRQALSFYRQEQVNKLLPLGDKAQGRLSALHDKCDCMLEFIANSSNLQEIRNRIDQLFPADDSGGFHNAVVLGTVHRTKGLEAARVFILAPELIPHPMASKDWEREQEKNIAWIAATRAKYDHKTGAPGTLIFCGRIPAIFQEKPTTYDVPVPEEDEERVTEKEEEVSNEPPF